MNKNFSPIGIKNPLNERGATVVMVALLFTVLLGFAAMAVDIGYLYAARNEMQNVADAAALGAARQLGIFYKGMDDEEQAAYDCSTSESYPCSDIVDIAQEVSLQNHAGGEAIQIFDEDVEIGTWSQSSAFTGGTLQPDAVRVAVFKDSTKNSPLTSIFASMLGVDHFALRAQATAALTAQTTANPGDLEVPIGISSYWFEKNVCNNVIAFSPSNDPASCAGWTSFDYNANNTTLQKIIEDDPNYQNDAISTADDTLFNFLGGEASAFDELLLAFKNKGYDVMDDSGQPIPLCAKSSSAGSAPCDAVNTEPLYYPEEYNKQPLDERKRYVHEWPTTVIVYESVDCANPNQDRKVVGFARVIIDDVVDAGGGKDSKIIRARVTCDYVDEHDSRGGGAEFSIKGSIPNLVQ